MKATMPAFDELFAKHDNAAHQGLERRTRKAADSRASLLTSSSLSGGTAGATGGSAFGQGAMVSGANGTALGTGAVAGFAGSTAIGAGAVTTAPNQIVVGTTSNTYVAPGITSAASLAAQSGPTNFVTSDAGGHLAVSNFGPRRS